MGIIRLDQLPEGSGNLTNDDIFLFMDDPSGSGVTKKISLNQISNAIGGGGGGNASTGDISFSGVSIIGSGTGSGDGGNKGTIELVPDATLKNNDQYLIVDPTAPNHIHLRAGGNQDDSSAELIIGGEYAHISITDYNHQVSIKTSYENPTTTSVQLFSIYDLSTFVGSNCVPINSVANIDGIDYTVVSCSSTEYEGEFLIGVTPTISIESIDQSVDFVDSGVQGSYGWNFQNDGNLSIPGNILLSNVASVASGTYDNGTGGNGGISLNCSVGYQLNWQGSHLKNTEIGDSTNASRTIYVDSPLQFPGSGVANVQVSSSGIVFSDGTSQTTAAVGGGGNPFDQNLNTSDDPTFTNLNLDNSEKIVLPNNTIVWIGSVIETEIGPSYDPVFFFPEGGANGYYDLQVGYVVGGNVSPYCNNIFISSIEEYTYNDIFGYKFVLGNNCALEAWSNPTWHLTNPTFYSPNGQNVNINFTTKLNSTGSIVRDNNSGDGNNKGTFKIIPDNSLLNTDQYLIVDPTSPDHIHLRAGGTQDNSAAELIIGGEYAHLRVNDYNHNISIRASSGGNIQQFNLGGAANHYCNGGEDVVSSSNIPIPLGSTFEYDNIVYTVNSLLNYDSENGVYCYNTSPTLPGEALSTGGKIVGTFDLTLPYSTKDYTFGNDGVLQLASGGIKFSDDTIQTTAATGGGGGLSDSNTYIICKTGDDLASKYAAAKLLTPGGNPLSATNRATLIIMPGNYSLSEVLVLDTSYVDIIGLGSMKLDRGCATAVTLNNDIFVVSSDVRIKGISVGDNTFALANYNTSIIENCIGGDNSFGGDYDTSINNITMGKYINCIGGNNSFGYICFGEFYNCIGGDNSFGYNGSLPGTFKNCSGEDGSFGSSDGSAAGYVSGTFYNCIGGDGSFGGGGGAGGTPEANGSFINCTGGDGSFGGYSTGDFKNCKGGAYSFGSIEGCAGYYIDCIGGDGSFGFSGAQMSGSNGLLIKCILTSGTFESPINSGKIRLCIDGNYDVINADPL